MTRQSLERRGVKVQQLKVDAFGERVALAIDLAGGSTNMAEKAGVSTSVLSKWRREESDPSRTHLVKLARAAGVSVEWLATGEEGPDRPVHAGEPGDVLSEEYALIPRYDVQVSTGHGALVDREKELGRVAFRRDWLRQEGFTAASLVLVSARGDSMEGAIGEGDALLVDTARRAIQGDGIYVLRMGDDVIAKRLQNDWQGGLWVRSDNPVYEDQHITDQAAANLDILGRVVWVGKRV